MNPIFPAILAGLLLLAIPMNAAEDRDTKVQNDRKEVSTMGSWIYNDLPKATEEARQTRKPMLVVFRCIP